MLVFPSHFFPVNSIMEGEMLGKRKAVVGKSYESDLDSDLSDYSVPETRDQTININHNAPIPLPDTDTDPKHCYDTYFVYSFLSKFENSLKLDKQLCDIFVSF